MATLKERIQALEAAADPSKVQPAANTSNGTSGRPVALPGVRVNANGLKPTSLQKIQPSREDDSAADLSTSPTAYALASIPALRPVKSPSPPAAARLPSSPSVLPTPTLSISHATPSPRRTSQSTSTLPTTYIARKPSLPLASTSQTAVPPPLPVRPSASSSPAQSSLKVNRAPEIPPRPTGAKHGHTLSTSSWASVSLSSDGEAEPSTSKGILAVTAPTATSDHHVLSTPPALPIRKTSVSSLSSTSSAATVRKPPPTAPIADLPSPTRTAPAVSYNTYNPPARTRTLPPALVPSPASSGVSSPSSPASKPTPDIAYAVRRKAPLPPPLTPRPSQQQLEAANKAATANKYDALFDAVLKAQQEALMRGVVLEPKARAPDQGWKRVSAASAVDERLLASVVRTIWERSGLDQPYLSSVWNSVTGKDEQPSLSKTQFAQGMRRIDDELLRRDLPKRQ